MAFLHSEEGLFYWRENLEPDKTYHLTGCINYGILFTEREQKWNRFGCVCGWRSRFVFSYCSYQKYIKEVRATGRHGNVKFMANYNQAPVLLAKGEKNRNSQFAYRPHELEYAICCCLGNRDMVTLKTMLFFTGESNNGDFRVAQKTIMDRMNISEKRYYEARKKLEEMHWIHYDDKANAIYVNYDKIYSDYKAYQKMNAGSSHNSSIRVSIYDSPDEKELQETSSDKAKSSCDDSQQDYLQDRYNNINNNTKNTIKNKKNSGGAGAAIAAPPQELIDKAFAYRNHREYWEEYMNELEQWIFDKIAELGIEKGTDEYKQKYDELVPSATQCLYIMYGYINSYDEVYKEQRWY